MRSAVPGSCTIAVAKANCGCRPILVPIAPSRPMAAISMVSPVFSVATSEIMPSIGKWICAIGRSASCSTACCLRRTCVKCGQQSIHRAPGKLEDNTRDKDGRDHSDDRFGHLPSCASHEAVTCGKPECPGALKVKLNIRFTILLFERSIFGNKYCALPPEHKCSARAYQLF